MKEASGVHAPNTEAQFPLLTATDSLCRRYSVDMASQFPKLIMILWSTNRETTQRTQHKLKNPASDGYLPYIPFQLRVASSGRRRTRHCK